MGNKNKPKKNKGGVVYSTDPNYNYQQEENSEETLAPEDQDLRVIIDRKMRKGKAVTLVTGFIGTQDALQDLARTLKTKCGVGGSAKNGEIIVQGEFRDKVYDLLIGLGYSVKKSGG